MNRLYCFIALLFSFNSMAAVPALTTAPDNLITLEARLDWALKSHRQNSSGSWVGFSIARADSSSGITIHEGANNLDTVILSKLISQYPDQTRLNETGSGYREIAFLFFLPAGRRHFDPVQLRVTDLDQPIRLSEAPVLWLGRADQKESFALLTSAYQKNTDGEVQEALIMAAAVHDDKKSVIAFLKQIIDGGGNDAIRESAVFWMGQQDDKTALLCLKSVIQNDHSHKIREQAVFAVSQIKSEDALNCLIDLARNAPSAEIKKKAVFWLGQKASDRAVRALEETVFNDEQTEIQKHAVFALSQQPHDEAVPKLMQIVETHPNPEIRKTAVFWLGETGDDRALEMLIKLVRQE